MSLPYTGDSFIVKLYHIFIDIVLPKECLGCGQASLWVCHRCLEECLAIKSPTCPYCDRLSPLGKTCPRCRQEYQLTGLRSVWYYREPLISIIKKIKYHHQFASIEALLPYLLALYRELPIIPNATIIITSVPSHSQRLSQYGYNQSELLAISLAKVVQRPYQRLLKRTQNSVSQTMLGRVDRFGSAAAQYKNLDKKIPLKSIVIIIDDVATTGATLASCAKELKQSGARSVWAITIAKG